MKKLLYRLGIALLLKSYTKTNNPDVIAIHSLRREIQDLEKKRSSLKIEVTKLSIERNFGG